MVKGTGQTVLGAANQGNGARKPAMNGKIDQSDQARRRTVFADTLWALINTREFILNH
jgi:hypothetical protein